MLNNFVFSYLMQINLVHQQTAVCLNGMNSRFVYNHLALKFSGNKEMHQIKEQALNIY